MTTLGNGNNNARSMNGLNDINANNIVCETIDTYDANIQHDLSVGNNIEVIGDYHSTNGDITLDNGSLTLTNGSFNTSSLGLTGDLLLYDKSTPTKYPYRFTTVGKNLRLQYENTITPKIYLDCSFNATGGAQLWFPNQTYHKFSSYFENDIYLNNLQNLYLGAFGTGSPASIVQDDTNRRLTLRAGGVGGNTNISLQTNDSGGTPYIITINPTTVSIPQILNLGGGAYPNVKTTLDTLTNATTGLTYDSITDTSTLDGSFNIVGNLDVTTNISNSGNFTSLGVTKIGNGSLVAPSGVVNRTFNVVSGEGGIKLARASASAGPFIEIDSVTADFQTVNNRVFIGGNTPTDERFRIMFRLGAGDQETFVTRRTGTSISTPLTISGNTGITGDLSVSGALTTGSYNPTSITTNTLVVNTAVNGNVSGQFPVNCDIAIANNFAILQNSTNTTVNNICRTIIASGLGQSANAGLQIRDTANNKNLYILPNATSGAYNGTTVTNDITLVAASGTVNSSYMNLTTWSTTNTGVRIAPDRTTVSAARIIYQDGTTGLSAGDRYAMSVVEDMNFLKGQTGCRTATFDIQSVAASTSTQAANLVQMGIVSVYFGEIYTGIFFYAGAAGITFRCALYDVGSAGARLAQRTTNFTSVVGINFCPFDTTVSIGATKYVCVMLVPTNTTHATYIYGGTNMNWGNTASAGNINLVACYYTGFAGTFPANFAATPTAFGSKFFLGLY